MQIGGGIYRSRKLQEPQGMETRPTSHKLRLSLFNIVQMWIEGTDFLDLFAGVGAVGLEAISRGAKSATFVEKEMAPFKLIKKNAETLGCQKQCRLYYGDVLKTLEKDLKGRSSFDIIFADPPYGLKLEDGTLYSEKMILEILNCSLLKPGGELFIEEGQEKLNFPAEFELKSVRSFGKTYLHQLILTRDCDL